MANNHRLIEKISSEENAVTSDSRPYLFLTSINPSISGRSEFCFKLARVNLKIACLLHGKTVLPGSLLFKSPFVRNLVITNSDFLGAGLLSLTLRSNYDTFLDYASKENDRCNADAIFSLSEYLDQKTKNIIHFDAQEASNQYIEEMKLFLDVLRQRSRKPIVKDHIDHAVQILDANQGHLDLEKASSILNGCYLSSTIDKVAKYLYCSIGAKKINSIPLLPKAIWEGANLSNRSPDVIGEKESCVQIADAAVMEFFAIRNDAIDRLSAKQIVSMREEPLTKGYIKELNCVIEEAKRMIENQKEVSLKLQLSYGKLSEEIKKCIYKKCKSEHQNLKYEHYVKHVIEDTGGLFIPFLSTIKKGAMSLSRTIAKRTKLSWLDYTTTPISTYVNNYQNKLINSKFDQ